jgi:hypothetical protein
VGVSAGTAGTRGGFLAGSGSTKLASGEGAGVSSVAGRCDSEFGKGMDEHAEASAHKAIEPTKPSTLDVNA